MKKLIAGALAALTCVFVVLALSSTVGCAGETEPMFAGSSVLACKVTQ